MTELLQLEKVIEQAWQDRDGINLNTQGEVRDAVEKTLDLLDNGLLRIADKSSGSWVVNQWAKKAVLLSF